MNSILLAAFLVIIFLAVFFIGKFFNQIGERMARLELALSETSKAVINNLGNNADLFGNVKEQLGRLEETSKNILGITKDITNLQDMLRAPKFRGQFGESLLLNILSQVLPVGYYQMQYKFKTNEIADAVIKIGEYLLPIDAKFSLENFQKYNESSLEHEKQSFLKKFFTDIKNRADEIASKYILQEENTFDFAFMYVPAENVYYEIITQSQVLNYCLSKKVIPVSANTFYAYLQVVCMGLKGLKVEENAKNILKNLSALNMDINKFKEDFDLLGGHLTNARRKYEDSEKRLDRFKDKLFNIQDDGKINNAKDLQDESKSPR